jgi:excisionase family DNA binding protein
MNNFLTAEDIAGQLKVKPDTISRWARAGKIPFLTFSKKVIRFDPVAVQQALRNRKPHLPTILSEGVK